jgi:repressor LexA
VLRAIEAYLRRHDRPPTVRDLCRATGIASTSYVFYLLAGLELDGYITREPGVNRSIRLTPAQAPGVPPLGTIPGVPSRPACGLSASTRGRLRRSTSPHQRTPLSGRMTSTLCALPVRSDAMIEAGICDGEDVLVLVSRRQPAPALPAVAWRQSYGGRC